ncbi:MAG TPA: FAD-dependent oxidoreductase [Gaiellaceae bacterium]|nr:FAD-dependent oxidoreductase [Gaiellaceae bacterium]
MAAPVLIAVDADPEVAAEVERQLVQRYGNEYRVVAYSDPDEAHGEMTELRDAGADVALVFAGPSSTTTARGELFEEVRRLHPHAKRAMLVSPYAWADERTAAAIRAAMALGRIDHYVLRPVAAPDEVFHEAVSDFLLEWARERRLVPQTVHIVGAEWSGRAFELREVFTRCAVPHAFCLVDSDEGRELLRKAGPGTELPFMLLPDGRVLSNPTDAEIAEAAGAPSGLEETTFDVVVVGAGPAGLSAAVYAASEGLRVLVVDSGGIGGQAGASSLIRNYLGFGKGISGSRLAEEAYEQAAAFGASFLFLHRVAALERSVDGFTASLSDGRSVSAKALILATGATYRRLGIESLEELTGAGVFYGAAFSEAPALTGKDVYVAGGGNSAGQAALHLARYARQVTLLVRAPALESMSHYLVQAIDAAPNVAVRTGTAVVGGGGEGHLQQLVLRAPDDGDAVVPADALFVMIGARPQTDWLPAEVGRDEQGFVLTGDDVPDGDWPLVRRPFSLETSVPGLLAAGDVRHASVKRVAAAVGEGSIAAQLVHRLFDEEVEQAAPREGVA